MYKCEQCGFECASLAVYEMHKEREEYAISEYEQKQLIKKHGKEWREHINESGN